jgi:hypothetical protein
MRKGERDEHVISDGPKGVTTSFAGGNISQCMNGSVVNRSMVVLMSNHSTTRFQVQCGFASCSSHVNACTFQKTCEHRCIKGGAQSWANFDEGKKGSVFVAPQHSSTQAVGRRKS